MNPTWSLLKGCFINVVLSAGVRKTLRERTRHTQVYVRASRGRAVLYCVHSSHICDFVGFRAMNFKGLLRNVNEGLDGDGASCQG